MKQENVLQLARSVNATIAETHISWVLLTKKYAYKIKKPVKTTFLDFSTLTKRKKLCQEELRLNKVLCPDIYLEVAGIKKENGDYSFLTREEKAVDYAVKMKRLDLKKQMHNMLALNKVTVRHIRELAKKIATFHEQTRVIKKGKRREEMKNDFKDLLSLRKISMRLLGKKISQAMEGAVRKENEFVQKNYSLFSERIQEGFIRDCHGDLHAGNIFLYEHPILFDRIEFNERFRHIDVLHEIAFLCMDLEASGYKRLSEIFLNYYLKYSKMFFGKKEKIVLNYFKCYTANVRLKINLIAAEQKGLNASREKEIRKYLQLMLKYVKK